MLTSEHPRLNSEERAALQKVESATGGVGTGDFYEVFFSRLKSQLLDNFPTADLDAAFAILESEKPELMNVRAILWDGEELTEVGETFLSWVEGSLKIIPNTNAEEFEQFLGRAEPFYNELDEFEESVEAEPESPAEDEEEAEEPAPVESEPLSPSPDLPPVDESIYAEPEAPAEADTLSLGDLPRLATAWAEVQRQAEEMGYDLPMAMGSTESQPPLPLAHEIVEEEEEPEPEEVVEEPEEPREAKPIIPPDKLTKLYESLPPEPEDFDQEDGELLTFSQAPSSPFEKKNPLVVKNNFLGYGKNSEGVVGLCGQLRIRYNEEEELKGRLESSNPLLFLQPARLSGTKTVVTYWLPPIAFPHPTGQLAIRTPLDAKILSLSSLFPKSRTDYLKDRQVLLGLAAPALVGCLYFGFVYFVTVGGIDTEAYELFPELYQAALDGKKDVDFQGSGLGLYRLRVVPASESLQMIWAAVLWLAPLASAKFFHFLSRERRRRFAGFLAASILLPTLALLLTWNFQDRVLPLYDHKDFAPLDLRRFLEWGIPANISVGLYLFLSEFGVWNKLVKVREFRTLLPIVLSVLYMLVMFVVIYGRSWLG